MENKDKSFDELMNETNEFINKMNSSDITMDEAMKLFKQGVENLKLAKDKLADNKAEIKKVLEDNKIEDFN